MRGAETLLVAVALGCDAFAVGMGIGTRFCSVRQVFRLSFHFGLFQFVMPLLGWFLGQNMVGIARQWAPWIAFVLLFFTGARMIHASLKSSGSERPEECQDPTRGFSLVLLSFATSVDALGVGFSLGILGEQLFLSAVCIGITACVMTCVAMKLGNRLSEAFGQRMGVVGGIILMAIAVKILAT